MEKSIKCPHCGLARKFDSPYSEENLQKAVVYSGFFTELFKVFFDGVSQSISTKCLECNKSYSVGWVYKERKVTNTAFSPYLIWGIGARPWKKYLIDGDRAETKSWFGNQTTVSLKGASFELNKWPLLGIGSIKIVGESGTVLTWSKLQNPTSTYRALTDAALGLPFFGVKRGWLDHLFGELLIPLGFLALIVYGLLSYGVLG